MSQLNQFQAAINTGLSDALNVAFPPQGTNYVTQSVGENGGDFVYVQGNPAGVLNEFYYPTFSAFNQAVEFTSGGWERTGTSFADQLTELYSFMGYRQSPQQLDTQNEIKEDSSDQINLAFEGGKGYEPSFQDMFGPQSRMFNLVYDEYNGLNNVGWVSSWLNPTSGKNATYQKAKYNQYSGAYEGTTTVPYTDYTVYSDASSVDVVDQFDSMTSALQWSIGQALYYGSLTTQGRNLVQSLSRNIKGYATMSTQQQNNTMTQRLSEYFLNGQGDYTQYFSRNFNDKYPNDFYQFWPTFQQILLGQLGTAANTAALNEKLNFTTAVSNLTGWTAASPAAVNAASFNASGLYSDVVYPEPSEGGGDSGGGGIGGGGDSGGGGIGGGGDSGGGGIGGGGASGGGGSSSGGGSEVSSLVPPSFKKNILSLQPYSSTGATVKENIVQGSVGPVSGSKNISLTLTQKDENSLTINNGNTTTTTSSSNVDYGGILPVFFCAGSSTSSSSDTKNQTSFTDYSENTQTNNVKIKYDSAFKQTWNPTTDGLGMWLDSEAIRQALSNTWTLNSDGEKQVILPYILSPNWPGGFGFETKQSAQKYLESGFAVPDSIIYSADPEVSINVTNSTTNNQKWTSEEFNKTQYHNSSAVGAFGFIFGYSGNSSVNQVSTQTNGSTTVQDASAENQFNISSGGLGNTNTSGLNGGPNEYYGFGALEIGYTVNVLGQPSQVTTNSDNTISIVPDGASGRFARSSMAELTDRSGQKKVNASYVIKTRKGPQAIHMGNDANVVAGSSTRDVITGGKGHDEIYGFKGSDVLHGNAGDDFLSGGVGKNYLTGGKGKDYFEISFSDHKENAKTLAVIQDFTRSNEKHSDVLWFTGFWDSESIDYSGNKVLMDGDAVAKLKGVDEADMPAIIQSAQFVSADYV